MPDPTKPTTNPTREQLREAIEKLNGSGAHACHCERSTDGGCKCALKDEYIEELMQLIDTYNQSKVLGARIDEIGLTKSNSEESYLGEDWFSDESIEDHSAHEVPLTYFEKRLATLQAEIKEVI